MFDGIRKFYAATVPVRILYHCIAIPSMFFAIASLASLLYYGFFEHRDWVNERIAAGYQKVEEQQVTVLEMILEVVPSRANDYHPPNPEQLAKLRTELSKLSGRVAGVDAVSEELISASSAYRGSISKLTGALVLYSPDDSESHGKLLLAVDRLDLAAQDYAEAVEARIGRFTRTLLPSV